MSFCLFTRSPKRFLLAWILPACGALMPLALSAAPAAEKTTEAAIIYPRASDSRPENAPGHGSSYSSGILVAAVLLAGAGGWLFWRGRTAPNGSVAVRKLAIAETKSLGNRQYLVVASYDDKKFLLSVCPGRIELLTPLDATPPSRLP